MTHNELYEFLEEKHDLYNRPEFVESDPMQVPLSFGQKEDIEIAAFFSASLAWGKRSLIIRSARRLMQLMGEAPYDFVMSANNKQLLRLHDFKHRTFQPPDALFFVKSLRNIYENHGGLEAVFLEGFRQKASVKDSLAYFHAIFFEPEAPERTYKHVANVRKKSAAKRLNMMLRWLVRHDKRGVDIGLWRSIPPAALYLPLDVHTGRCGRKLGLLSRKQNDWQACAEITYNLRKFDANDPVKYDFALFGLGLYEKLCHEPHKQS